MDLIWVFNSQRHNVFLCHIGPVILFFGHHFRDLLIPNFMVVMILISFNHILLNLDSFDFYCGSLIIYRVAFLVVSGAVQAIPCISWTYLFLAISLNVFLSEKMSSLILYKVMSSDQKYNMSSD